MDFSIGNNNQNLLSGDTEVNAVTSSNGIWANILGIIPSVAQSGFALLANNRNARAQETIARQQGGLMSWMQWGNNTTGLPPQRNNSIIWIILVIVAAVVLFMVFRKK